MIPPLSSGIGQRKKKKRTKRKKEEKKKKKSKVSDAQDFPE